MRAGRRGLRRGRGEARAVHWSTEARAFRQRSSSLPIRGASNPRQIVTMFRAASIEGECRLSKSAQMALDTPGWIVYSEDGWSADRIRFRRSFVSARCLFSYRPPSFLGRNAGLFPFDLESKT